MFYSFDSFGPHKTIKIWKQSKHFPALEPLSGRTFVLDPLNNAVWGFTVGFRLNWTVLVELNGFKYFWDGYQGFWKGQIVVLSGPDGAKDLFTVVKDPDRQGGS